MQIVHSLEQRITERPVILTIGKFDGVHLGHRRLILQAIERASVTGSVSAVLTFHPHPRTVLNPKVEFKLLTSIEERAALVAELGADYFVVVPFNHETMSTPAYEYVVRLCTAMPIRELWVGAGFALGRKREGTVERLREIGQELGYTVGTVGPVELDGQVVSASRVRHLLGDGAIEQANQLLGRAFWVRGVVQQGDQRGRTIGFPTANLSVAPDHIVPANGVYACWSVIESGPYASAEPLPTVTNVGVRPTFDGTRRTIEAHLLDWSGDLYGQTLRLSFGERLRAERKFADIDELVAQIGQDAQQARTILQAITAKARNE
ncbi:MAG: bifunctional riboflavin kinase/FAD synthetase [Chloroflexaceae bacterium]|nr:bifunctional riboflavin kinase/FAD synthetase [Chloroflexaceae bacterium]NJL35190.1 bifunctional riboflavin kinase/FAD synthetase [Chloroflexaceae bacterium]